MMDNPKFKVGDVVAICGRNGIRKSTILHVTPSGRVTRLDNFSDMKFNQRGRQIPSDIWSRSYIELWNESHGKEVEIQNVKGYRRWLSDPSVWNDVPDEIVKEIYLKVKAAQKVTA